MALACGLLTAQAIGRGRAATNSAAAKVVGVFMRRAATGRASWVLLLLCEKKYARGRSVVGRDS
jgi:hypothetical protein